MKVKFIKKFAAYKVGEVHDLENGQEYIDNGMAEAVKADNVDDAVTALEDKIEKSFTEKMNGIIQKALDGVTKKLSKPRIIVGGENIEDDPRGGFRNQVDFYKSVIAASRNPGKADERLVILQKSTTGNTEGTSIGDAGYTVPIEYTGEIFKMYGDQSRFADLASNVPMTSSSIKIPVLKNYDRSNVDVTKGEIASWTSEASNITQSKQVWEQLSLAVQKLTVLVPVSDELLEDNIVSLPSVIGSMAAYQMTKAENAGILQGNAGFTGIIGNAATKSVTHSTSDSTTSLSAADIYGMFAAFAVDDASYDNAVWFVHPTVIPSLFGMTTGNYPVYMGPGLAQNAPNGTLLGRPLMVTGHCNTLGTSGDILLADLKKYIIGRRGGLNAAASIHVFFLTNEMAFRFTQRMNGKPGLSGTITLADGSTTVSPFVTLTSRP
jgi:HK97 family phage major capsid protein